MSTTITDCGNPYVTQQYEYYVDVVSSDSTTSSWMPGGCDVPGRCCIYFDFMCS